MQGNLKELIKIIEDKSNIVDIVSDYISLEKKGNNYIGLCPFHTDSNPSLSVSNDKGIFKCFSCGAGGGVITFIQNYEGISFIESVKKISEKYSIEWKDYITFKERKINPEEERAWEINREASNFFSYNIKNLNDKRVIKYLNKRNLNKDIIEKFKIGFSGKKGSLIKFLKSKNFSEEEIIKYGLSKRQDDETINDYFIDRLIFPIENSDGKISGFSGRVIEDVKFAKYLNSPETPVFKKSSILYNMHNAKISANLNKELIVVEGFMDVISLYKAGIYNSVATMGIALTNIHIKNMNRITTNITLSFDSDIPGINATILAGKKLLKEGMKVSVIEIRNGKDFDELLKLGKKEVNKTINNKKLFIDFFKEKIYKLIDFKKDLKDGTVDFDIIRKLLSVLALSKDKMLINFNLNEISKKYNIDKLILQEEIDLNNKNQYVPSSNIDYQINTEYHELEKNFSEINKRISYSEKYLIKLEKNLIIYAIRNNYAFDYLVKYPTKIYGKEYERIWNSYKKLIINNIDILDKEIVNKINYIKSNNEYEDFETIDTLEEYVSYIENWDILINEFLKEKVRDQINKENDINDTDFLFTLIKKNNF